MVSPLIRHSLTAGALFCTVFLAFDTSAKLAPENFEHAKNAMLFADIKDWASAMPHAQASNEPVLVKLITWESLLDPDSGASFDDITRFISENPSWPEQKKLHLRAETALHGSNVADSDIINWFADQTPITGIGKIALAEALIRKNGASAKTNALIRDAWKNGDFDESQEKEILESYGKLFSHEDDISRIDRLLWEGRITPAKRILNRVPEGHQKLFQARIALIELKRTSVFAVARVPSALKKDPGLIYDRMLFRLDRDDRSGVREMMLAAPANLPHPEKWWKYREQQIREAIGEGNIKLAGKLIASHGQIDGIELADALWLEGWLKLEFLKQPKEAYDLFYRMFNSVHYPVSKARAAYWTARAAEKADDNDAAENWYNTAAAYPTTFYGQLASLKHNGSVRLHIPAPPYISSSSKEAFEGNELTHAIRICAELGKQELAARLISDMIETSDDAAIIAQAAALGNDIGHVNLSVHGAKKAMQQNVVLMDIGYPQPPTPAGLAVERPLALAISRQESEFDPAARSPTGALGMMQLMPKTAKETAHKAGLDFSHDQLFDPAYNMTVGSIYLSRMVENYSGSYVMAIAAYNAGPGNVHNWAQDFGTPGNDVDNAVNWIEKIPYLETRNYVQRVMENLQVYRHLEADGDSAKLRLGEDLVR